MTNKTTSILCKNCFCPIEQVGTIKKKWWEHSSFGHSVDCTCEEPEPEELLQGNIKDEKSGTQIRRLTPLECERLMGWQDGWTKYGVNADNGPDGVAPVVVGKPSSGVSDKTLSERVLHKHRFVCECGKVRK